MVDAWRTGNGPRPDGAPAPPGRPPMWRGGRPLKRWRYVGAFSAELSLCVAVAHVGPATAAWWAVWDRADGRLTERTRRSARTTTVAPGRARVADGNVRIELEIDEEDGVETVSRHGRQLIWTRKQGGVAVRGEARVGGRTLAVDARGIVDESAGHHARRTAWRWAAGVGVSESGARVAWNLVDGIHDDPRASERSVWVEGVAGHVAPASFAHDLSRVRTADGGDLRFAAEATRARRERLLLVASEYVQPFGTASGTLPHAGALREGYGVMERHSARW